MPATDFLPIQEIVAPSTVDDAAERVRDAHHDSAALYLVGGGTSLVHGRQAEQAGIGLSLAKLNRIVDYPARDMTITIEAGVTMSELATVLAEHGQQLPIDAPDHDQATIGGVVAANWNGPRRYGLGTIRDYVVGIHGIDGRGVAFKGGGRVVKNVAGYDFCKLLTGSFGCLAAITQVTLKLRPLPEARRAVVASCPDLQSAESLLKQQVDSRASLVGLELLAGPYWPMAPVPAPPTNACYLVAWIEGTLHEADWLTKQVCKEWRNNTNDADDAAKDPRTEIQVDVLDDSQFDSLRRDLICKLAEPQWSLAIKANMRPSQVTPFVDLILNDSPNAIVQAHAGSGVVVAGFTASTSAEAARALLDKLRADVTEKDGHLSVLADRIGLALSAKSYWGDAVESPIMHAVKEQFDPKHILNPGRFIYSNRSPQSK